MCNRIRHVIPRLALENLYTSMVRPILDYTDMLYNNCTLSIGRSIEGIQRRAALICTGAYRHTEHRTLLHEVGWLSLETHHKIHSVNTYYKIILTKFPKYITSVLPQQIQNVPTYLITGQIAILL